MIEGGRDRNWVDGISLSVLTLTPLFTTKLCSKSVCKESEIVMGCTRKQTIWGSAERV